MSRDIDELLGAFDDSALSVRLIGGVCRVVPFAPAHPTWFSLVEGLKLRDPKAGRPVLDKARELTRREREQRALWMVSSLDTADSGISVFSGIRSAVRLYQATTGRERLDAVETDTQQAVDAVLKGLCLAFVVTRLFEGSLAEKVEAFRKTETGQAIIFYYAAIELGLPFADNALLGGGGFVKGLFDRHGREQVEKLAAVTGEADAQEALSLMERLFAPVETMVGLASSHLGTIAETAAGYLGKAIDVGDKMAGAAATAADVLPVYRYLGARLVAEVALAEALRLAAEEKARAATANPASVAVRYTRSADDLPAAPARRRGCFGLWVALLAATTAALAGAGGLLAALLVIR